MSSTKFSIIGLATVLALLLAPSLSAANFGFVSYNCGTFTGYTSISGQDFNIPLWDPDAHPGLQLDGAELTLQLTVSANVDFFMRGPGPPWTTSSFPNTRGVFPSTTLSTCLTPTRWRRQIRRWTMLRCRRQPAAFLCTVGTASRWKVSPEREPSLGPQNSPSLTIQNAEGAADGIVSGVNYATVTETATQTYEYEYVPEPASFLAVLASAVMLLARAPRRRTL